MCLTFVICAFLEYAMVNKFARYERNRENRVKVQSKSPAACCTWLVKFPTRSKRLDMASRILFPSVFLFFNVIYWSTYWPGA